MGINNEEGENTEKGKSGGVGKSLQAGIMENNNDKKRSLQIHPAYCARQMTFLANQVCSISGL